jgi:hypothetical protein
MTQIEPVVTPQPFWLNNFAGAPRLTSCLCHPSIECAMGRRPVLATGGRKPRGRKGAEKPPADADPAGWRYVLNLEDVRGPALVAAFV